MKHKKYNNNPMKDMNNFAIGSMGVGITGAITSGIASKAPSGTPSMSEGFSTIASFTPIMGTVVASKSILKQSKKLKY